MVVGDIVNDVVQMTTATTHNLQPALTVEIIITQVGHTTVASANEIQTWLADGVLTSVMFANKITTMNPPAIMKMGITNSHYLTLWNGAAGTETLSYTGIQIK